MVNLSKYRNREQLGHELSDPVNKLIRSIIVKGLLFALLILLVWRSYTIENNANHQLGTDQTSLIKQICKTYLQQDEYEQAQQRLMPITFANSTDGENLTNKINSSLMRQNYQIRYDDYDKFDYSLRELNKSLNALIDYADSAEKKKSDKHQPQFDDECCNLTAFDVLLNKAAKMKFENHNEYLIRFSLTADAIDQLLRKTSKLDKNIKKLSTNPLIKQMMFPNCSSSIYANHQQLNMHNLSDGRLINTVSSLLNLTQQYCYGTQSTNKQFSVSFCPNFIQTNYTITAPIQTEGGAKFGTKPFTFVEYMKIMGYYSNYIYEQEYNKTNLITYEDCFKTNELDTINSLFNSSTTQQYCYGTQSLNKQFSISFCPNFIHTNYTIRTNETNSIAKPFTFVEYVKMMGHYSNFVYEQEYNKTNLIYYNDCLKLKKIIFNNS